MTGTESYRRAERRAGIGVHIPTGHLFLRRVFTCGYCGNTFRQNLTNGFRPCPECRSRQKANHTPPSRQVPGGTHERRSNRDDDKER